MKEIQDGAFQVSWSVGSIWEGTQKFLGGGHKLINMDYGEISRLSVKSLIGISEPVYFVVT
jgi:hypothetical protein